MERKAYGYKQLIEFQIYERMTSHLHLSAINLDKEIFAQSFRQPTTHHIWLLRPGL